MRTTAAVALSLVSISLVAASHSASSIVGLDPEKYDAYIPSPQGAFACLDGSKSILFSAVNDDYCDCEDGSDEPGTSACRKGTFYCHNEGHVPGRILSSRVGDGICDPECCDGTDEPSGFCANTCVEVGEAHRSANEETRKIRKTGSKIRSSYIAFAEKEKKRLEDDIVRYGRLVTEKEQEVAQAQRVVDEVERDQGEILEKRKNSPLYTSLLDHRLSLSRLRSRTARLESELDSIKGIMEDLVRSYNPNYQDMAVRAAAVGYMELFHGGATPPAEGGGSVGSKPDVNDQEGNEEAASEEPDEAVEEQEQEITNDELDHLDRLDLMGLLVGWEDGTASSSSSAEDVESLLYNLGHYIPEPFVESFEFLKSNVVLWLIKLGVVDKSTKAASAVKPSTPVDDNSSARQALNAATTSLTDARNSLSSSTTSLADLTDRFGPKGEWKKLDGTCIEQNLGEYTYELCFFGQATQKSNKGGGNNSLGHFKTWNYESLAEPGTEQYYASQLYDNGAKCWNGPHRSVKLHLSCAKENQLLSVVEAEKCEYVFTATSPALCWPAAGDAPAAKGKSEL